jgi:cysteine desulfurase
MIYLDWAASAPPEADVLDSVRDASLTEYANPSAAHAAGRRAEATISACRERLAALLSAGPREIAFTSGGTESNNLICLSLLARSPGESSRSRRRTVIVSGLEHPSVSEPVRLLEEAGCRCLRIPPGPAGILDPERIGEALDESTVLVSVMHVSNEIGSIQPVEEIGRIVSGFAVRTGRRIPFHCDAVQSFGKLPLKPDFLGLDAASLSAHKIGGPRGIGALWIRGGREFTPLLRGGGQEGNRRPGTENLAGIVGFAMAAERKCLRMGEDRDAARGLSRRLIQGILSIPSARIVPEGRIQGPEESWSPYIVAAAFPPVPGEVILNALDRRGICISTGSSCGSRRGKLPAALLSMGYPEAIARCMVRISIGPRTTTEDIDVFLDAAREESAVLGRLAGRTR